MSEESSRKIAEAVNGFEQLDVTEVGANTYTVTSWRNDSTTAHEVNLEDRTCTCEDEAFNTEGNEVCDHIMKANNVAQSNRTMAERALWTVVNHHDRILSQTPRIETDGHTSQSEPSEATQAEVEEAVAEATADLDRVDTAREWLGTGFAQPEKVEITVGEHDGTMGVRLEPDNQAMSDGVYESFKAVVNAVEESTVHVGFGDDPCNTCGEQDGEFWYHIPDSRLEEWA